MLFYDLSSVFFSILDLIFGFRLGVLKNRGNSIRWGSFVGRSCDSGGLVNLLKFLTRFSSAREAEGLYFGNFLKWREGDSGFFSYINEGASEKL